jgi:peptidoglycan/LPS O-acetylase OafA/YrhL
VVFHSAESFGPNNHYWAIVDCSPSEFLEDVRFACHSFRLELFYVMTGFFARLLLVKRGTRPFIHNRVQRILVPLVVGWVLLYPIVVLIWLWGKSVSGGLVEFGVPAEASRLSPLVLWIGFFMSGGFLQKFGLIHLWFLHQLLVLYALMLVAVWLTARSRWREAWMRQLDRWFAVATSSRWSLFFFAIPTIPMMLFMDSWTVDTPKESLLPHLPTTILFGFCFWVGWLWHRQPTLLEYPAIRWGRHLLVGVLVWLAFQLFDWSSIRGMPPAERRWIRVEYLSLYAFMMWALALGFLGLFTRFHRSANAWTRYIAEASYWIYIAHLPLVVALQVAFGRVPLPWPLKFPLISAIAFLILFLSYHYLARGSFIGVQLNGRRYPRLWPWQKPGP